MLPFQNRNALQKTRKADMLTNTATILAQAEKVIRVVLFPVLKTRGITH